MCYHSKIFVVLVCSLLLSISTGWAYTEIPVDNGGAVTGQVTMKGDDPESLAYNLALFPDPAFCGRISTGTGWRLYDQFQVSADGALQNAIVILEGIHQGKPFTMPPAVVEAKDCIFSPNTLVVRNQQEIRFLNMDPIVHDIQLYETAPNGSSIIFHRPLRMNPYHSMLEPQDHDHRPGEPLIDTFQFTKGRRIFLAECGQHPYMQTWGLAVTNPYYAITDKDGRFTISDIPEGVYSLIAWHPWIGGILEMKVVVLANDTLKTQFIFDAPPIRKNSHTTMVKNPHFSFDAIGRDGKIVPDVIPDHEVQNTPHHHH
ncbi:carboxypeptidase regulatory-like domain-containing protein [Candidatus Nitronereus thalassa]|uniref:Carboxypeptidase regulatory-like domain-containing protein n=1 Tax=Candidatus Nitronereus thalassa TaxID=3020898 RepID=A0ABU3K8V2_9BACT|nr:carboxypeptidase regulatory-like domain-containing protein [Candidatus Nitronereus thalassa]MDT7042743.1 carboxypeptidase regulatory-like domain-containing protein [Candidatus Nitronereus thalassa]